MGSLQDTKPWIPLIIASSIFDLEVKEEKENNMAKSEDAMHLFCRILTPWASAKQATGDYIEVLP